MKLRVGGTRHSFLFRFVRAVLILGLGLTLVGGIVFYIDYQHFQQVVDDRLAQGPLFASIAQIYAAPLEVRPGQQLSASSIAASLRRAGYNNSGNNDAMGSFQLRDESSIYIKPGPQSYMSSDAATISTSGGVVQSITAENGAALAAYKLEPQLITALSEDKNRTKRRMVTYREIPPRMVDAVIAIEDRRFFQHGGINYVRTVKCVVHDILAGRKDCGGSTITQQLAKNFFLTPDKKVSRKIEELMITFQLESRFTKQQIFEMYANEINIGHRGSYAINGFGEAAQAFMGKDLGRLDTADCALIAGMIQSPSWRNPYRHPDRAIERRNVVLDSMVETGALTESEAAQAKAEPIHLAPPNIDASEAPYFVDLVHDQLVQRLGDQGVSHGSLRIYTSLDPELQRAAADAVEVGMRNVDDLVRHRHRRDAESLTYPQVALVALNPHTGQILAMVGGRNYAVSQLDHALAERPTGSTFKPFVYATAYSMSVNGTSLGSGGVFNALTRLNDDPQDFGVNGQSYIPGNFVKGEYPGMITAADSLAHSLNIATISLAQMVGYGNVASLARASGILNARGTPSVAIGTYNATPIDLAGAYTVFANNGVHLKPWVLASVRNPQGDIVADFAPEAHQVLDPRAAYLTQSLLQGVINRGTGSTVRKHGFTAPAAGKTGTEHDSWFAGYSSNLLCIVWIGNDDYTDIKLQGADAAAPIWAEFMNRAIRLPQYSDMKPFLPAPEGVENLRINRATNLPVDDSCPGDSFEVAFLIGTAPQGTCSRMGMDIQTLGSNLLNGNGTPPDQPPTTPDAQPADQRHRNTFEKLFGIGKPQTQPQTPQ